MLKKIIAEYYFYKAKKVIENYKLLDTIISLITIDLKNEVFKTYLLNSLFLDF